MKPLARAFLALKALRQLGPGPLGRYGLYRLGLWSGLYRRVTSRPLPVGEWSLQPILPLPPVSDVQRCLDPQSLAALLAEADEIAAGKVRLFGGPPADLRLTFDRRLQHWTVYERRPALLAEFYTDLPDVKFLWEPARFGWAFPLGRAYLLSGREKYAETFWRLAEQFLDTNPPYLGPHWMSAQEVALRLMAFVWAGQVFADSPASTPARRIRLGRAVAAHAARIPATLVYARAQNNNHLLSEAAGLFTAGLALPSHPQAARWRTLGWKWLNLGLQAQIDDYGEYSQHSTNYQRLMLQLALWTDALLRQRRETWPRPTLQALGRATLWLLGLLDPVSGQTPNLGANDGAYPFPLSTCPFEDFRPVAHAAARAFLNYRLPSGPWDETARWFGLPLDDPRALDLPRYPADNLTGRASWACLRAVRLTTRPSHADQLHLDLWWRGLNLACDAGTYLYNAPPPWDNPLTSTLVHNTVSVDGREQMTRAGRFLYLDWADAYYKTLLSTEEDILQRAQARHYAYRRLGIRHTRTVTLHAGDRWRVEDELLFLPGLPWKHRRRAFRLHWLLPDWPWQIERGQDRIALRLESPHGPVTLNVATNPSALGSQAQVSLVRAGETVHGADQAEAWRGWVSPTYGIKRPALSLAVIVPAAETFQFITEFRLPE